MHILPSFATRCPEPVGRALGNIVQAYPAAHDFCLRELALLLLAVLEAKCGEGAHVLDLYVVLEAAGQVVSLAALLFGAPDGGISPELIVIIA